MPAPFDRDPQHWLRKYSPAEWIRASLNELVRAEAAFASKNARAAIAGCKRAAGMALNALLIVKPNEGWGRTYVDHLLALSHDESAPDAVRQAAQRVLGAEPHASSLVILRSPSADRELVEAVRDVQAHAYAVVKVHDAI